MKRPSLRLMALLPAASLVLACIGPPPPPPPEIEYPLVIQDLFESGFEGLVLPSAAQVRARGRSRLFDAPRRLTFDAVVTLMAYHDTPIEGVVESLGWGIAQSDGAPGYDLLPSISPTFEWIRLAQRIPVRVHLIDVPDEIKLRVGMTCSVLVTADVTAKVPATPAALQ